MAREPIDDETNLPPEDAAPHHVDTPLSRETHEMLREGAAEAIDPDDLDTVAPPYLGDAATIDALLRNMAHALMVPLETGQPPPMADAPTSKPQSAGDEAQSGIDDAPGLEEEEADLPPAESPEETTRKLRAAVAKAEGTDGGVEQGVDTDPNPDPEPKPEEGTAPPPAGDREPEPAQLDIPPRRVDPQTEAEVEAEIEARFLSETEMTARVLCGLDRAYRPVPNWNVDDREHGLPDFLRTRLELGSGKDGVEQVQAALALMMQSLFGAAAEAQRGRDFEHLTDATVQEFTSLILGAAPPQV